MVQTDNFTISYDKQTKLAKVVFVERTLLSLDVLYSIQLHLEMLTGGNQFLLLTNMSNKVTPTREAYDFYADKKRATYILKEAFVLESAALKIAANFYFKVKKPIIPSKVFDTEKEAEFWLKQEIFA
jgi:hypothetical protein